MHAVAASDSIIQDAPTPLLDPVLLALIEIIREGLLRDGQVRLFNFGTFKIRWVKAHRIKHPKTGEMMLVAAHSKVQFIPAKVLRELVEPNPKPVVPVTVLASASPAAPTLAAQTQAAEKIASAAAMIQESAELDRPPQRIINAAQAKWLVAVAAALPLILFSLSAELDSPNAATAADVGAAVSHKTQANVNESPGVSAEVSGIPDTGNSNDARGSPSATGMLDGEARKRDHKTGPAASLKPGESHAQPFSRNEGRLSVPAPVTAQGGATGSVATSEAPPLTPVTTQLDKDTSAPAVTGIEHAAEETAVTAYFQGLQGYQVQTGDSLWSLAKRFYGDPLLWPLIYRANNRLLRHPDRLQRNEMLNIPPLRNHPQQLHRHDRRQTAEAYVMVYQYYAGRQAPNAYYFLIGARQFDLRWLRQQHQQIQPAHRVYLD